MRRHIANALAAVAVAWLGGAASAGDPPVTLLPSDGAVAVPANAAPVGGAPYAMNCGGCGAVERGGWYGSAGVLFLKQTGTRDLAWRSTAFSDVNPEFGDTTILATGREEFTHDFDLSGRLELGWKGSNGYGARFRYFWLRTSSTLNLLDDVGVQTDPGFQGVAYNQITGVAFTPASPLGVGFTTVGTADSPSIFSLTRDLKLQSWDLELTSDCSNCGGLELTYTAGLRFLHIEQGFGAADQVIDPAAIALPDVIPALQAFSSRHTVNGFGPTVGVNARYGLGGDLKAIGNAQFGLLYYRGSQSVVGGEIPSETAVQYHPIQALRYGADQDRRGVLPTGELELGAEWGRIIGNNGPEVFVRGSMLSQVYWGAGTSARVNFNSNPANEDLIFFGYALSVGIRY